MRGTLKERAERRRYASDRAGASGREFARERVWAFARSKSKAFSLIALLTLAFIPVIWLALSPIEQIRGFALGAYVAGVVGWLYHWAVLASGAASITMGQEGEIWTDQELARLGRDWRIINHVTFRQGDIDHVAIGPDGVIVIETKWTSARVRLDGRDQWLRRAFVQAADNASDVRKVLGWGARPERPVSPLVVVWGPQVEPASDELYQDDRGVNAIAGRHLRQTLTDLDRTDRLDRAERDRIYDVIRSHVDRRDRRDAELTGPARAPFDKILTDWLIRCGVALVGFLLSSLVLRLGFHAFLAVQVTSAVGGVIAIRSTTVRRFGWAWLVGTQAVTVLLAVYAVAETLPWNR